MEKSLDVTVSDLKKEESKGNISLYKKIYMECTCGSSCDLGRISLFKDMVLNGNKWMNTCNEVTFELPFEDPVRNFICNQYFKTPWDYFSYSFKKFFRRIKLAWGILIFKKVYVTSDIFLDFKSARTVAVKLLKALDEMEKDNV